MCKFVVYYFTIPFYFIKNPLFNLYMYFTFLSDVSVARK